MLNLTTADWWSNWGDWLYAKKKKKDTWNCRFDTVVVPLFVTLWTLTLTRMIFTDFLGTLEKTFRSINNSH